jgi:homoserine kinase
MTTAFTVSVPATSGNIGAGFDCMGVALSLYNSFHFSPADELHIKVTGVGADKLPRNRHNLVYHSWQKYWQMIDKPEPPVAIAIDLAIPTARGLGSSATAICGGLYGANVWAGSPLTKAQLVKIATEIEGHPDNVAPALLGGCQLIADDVICPITWHDRLAVVVAIPEFELATAKARQVLPKQVPLSDAIFNCARVGLLTQALASGRPDWLRSALDDRLHQPYRQSLIPAMSEIHRQVIQHQGYGMVISGAGPTLLAICAPEKADTIGAEMQRVWHNQDIASRYLCLTIDRQGTTHQ